VDDFVWALMQVVRYYQYLKDERTSTGPRRKELLLRVIQRSTEQTGNPKVLDAAMAKLHGADQFCTCEPHLVGKEVFGSQKCKAHIPLGLEGKSHRLDKVNFLHPRIATKSSRANHPSCSLANVVEEFSPNL
jgi:hypothetical protein